MCSWILLKNNCFHREPFPSSTIVFIINIILFKILQQLFSLIVILINFAYHLQMILHIHERNNHTSKGVKPINQDDN